MKNWMNRILKKIYIFFGFKVSYHWAEILFKNRIIYTVMLMSNSYTMKQFRNKNLRLLNYTNSFDMIDKFNFKTKYDVIEKINYFNKMKKDLGEDHKDRISSYIKDDLGVSLE